MGFNILLIELLLCSIYLSNFKKEVVRNCHLITKAFISKCMQIMFIDNKYNIVDSTSVIISADSVEELYSKAIQILQAFENPIDSDVPTAEQSQQAIDLLSGKI
tara:strand:+ start:1084 stop:1395 length:312 start_codon:yes stop_codon:yes gene_type:complete